MRVVQLRRGRIVKFASMGLGALILLLILVSHFGGSTLGPLRSQNGNERNFAR